MTVLPTDAVELAYNHKCTQAFYLHETLYAVQFHPEFSYGITRKLMDLRINKGIDVDSDILAESINSNKVLKNYIEILKRGN